MLTGAKATLADVRHEIDEWLPSVAKDDDRVLIYFAGHGFMYQGKGYLAPYDFDLTKIAGTGIRWMSWARRSVRRSRRKSKILLTDACHSGAITPEDTAESERYAGRSEQVAVFAHRQPRPRAIVREPGFGRRPRRLHLLRGEGHGRRGRCHRTTALSPRTNLPSMCTRRCAKRRTAQQNPTSDRAQFRPQYAAGVRARRTPRRPMRRRRSSARWSSKPTWTAWKCSSTASPSARCRKASRSTCPACSPGEHTVKGVKMGYEPDGPRQEMVYPGQESTVTHQDPDSAPAQQGRGGRARQGHRSTITRAASRTTRKPPTCFEKAFQLTPLTARRPFIWAPLTTRCSTKRRPRAVFQEGHRHRPRLSGSARQLRRHAARYRRRG